MNDEPGKVDSLSLFHAEEQVLAETEAMLRKLQEVGQGVTRLAEAYRRGYNEQRRMVRLSDRTQYDLQAANQRLNQQAEELRGLNQALTDEVDERRRLEDELRRLAATDSLTGAYNRRYIMEMGVHEVHRTRRHGGALSVLLMDLDHFKRVNDTLGHAAGDGALVHFVAVVRGRLREGDVLGRFGGEEFAVLLPEADPTDARDVAERIRAALEATPVPDIDWPLTVSIGVATYTDEDGTIDRTLNRADHALYTAKHQGRNRVVAVEATETPDPDR